MSDEEQSTAIATVAPPFSGVLATQQSRAVFLPANLAQAMELAHFMAGGIGVRQWMRGNPSACLALIQISMRWGMDPYIVANKAYYANDTLSFESQLVNAVLNASGLIAGRLKVEFAGDASAAVGKETLNCRVTGRLLADPDQVFVHEQALCTITTRNSPLWNSNPKQQLQYYTTRAWARLYLPEVLLGIYTPDEIADGAAQRIEDQSAPRDATPAPDRRNFQGPAAEERAEDAEFDEIETHIPKEEADADEPDDDNAAAAAVDGGGHVDADQPGGDASDSATRDNSAATATAGEPELDTAAPAKDILDTVPMAPPIWETWKAAVVPAIAAVATRKQFDALRRRIALALEAADGALLGEVQDLLTEKLIALPEDKK